MTRLQLAKQQRQDNPEKENLDQVIEELTTEIAEMQKSIYVNDKKVSQLSTELL